MSAGPGARLPDEAVPGAGAGRADARRTALLSGHDRLGGATGNEILTSAVGAVLTVLLAAEGLTLLRLSSLLREHMVIGLLLVGPLALKLASTGYRFVRYYAGTPAYREKGPPLLALRVIAPVLVLATVVIMVTGVWMLLLGHRSDLLALAHKAGFIVWAAVFAVHFLSYLPRMVRSLRADWAAARRRAVPASALRGGSVAAAVALGAVLAVALLPLVTSWQGRR